LPGEKKDKALIMMMDRMLEEQVEGGDALKLWEPVMVGDQLGYSLGWFPLELSNQSLVKLTMCSGFVLAAMASKGVEIGCQLETSLGWHGRR